MSDVHKQIIYYDFFNFGAMVDFDNVAKTNFLKALLLFTGTELFLIYTLPSEGTYAVKSAVKYASMYAVFNAALEIKG